MSRVKLTPKADFVLETLSPAEKSEAVRLFEAMKADTLKKLNFQPVPGVKTLMMKRMKDRMMLLCKERGADIEVIDLFRSAEPPAPTPAAKSRAPGSRPARKKKR